MKRLLLLRNRNRKGKFFTLHLHELQQMKLLLLLRNRREKIHPPTLGASANENKSPRQRIFGCILTKSLI